jgi:hypothetical protein
MKAIKHSEGVVSPCLEDNAVVIVSKKKVLSDCPQQMDRQTLLTGDAKKSNLLLHELVGDSNMIYCYHLSLG